MIVETDLKNRSEFLVALETGIESFTFPPFSRYLQSHSSGFPEEISLSRPLPNLIEIMGSGLTPEQNRIFSDIGQYIEDVKSISLNPSRYDRDKRNFYALSMVLFALANRLIDLGRETVYTRGFAGPEEELKNKVIFKRLSDYGVIDPSTRQDLIRLVDFRNRCSHHYHELTKGDIVETIESIPRYEIFVQNMRDELCRTGFITKKQVILIAGIILLVVLILLALLLS